jgi:hypothetical protein
MNDDYFTKSVLVIIAGIGVGMLLSAGAQQLLNKHYVKTCPAKPGHQLIYTQGFLGDTFYCLDKRTL